jgi:hypothetical protein
LRGVNRPAYLTHQLTELVKYAKPQIFIIGLIAWRWLGNIIGNLLGSIFYCPPN